MRQFETFGALPNAGGLRDQWAGELERMKYARDVETCWRLWKARKPGQEDVFIEAYPWAWSMVISIEKLRMSSGK